MFNYSVHKSYLIEGNLKTNGNSKSQKFYDPRLKL
jgi:hypothetical protein